MNSLDDGTESETTETSLASRLIVVSGAILFLIAVITMFVY